MVWHVLENAEPVDRVWPLPMLNVVRLMEWLDGLACWSGLRNAEEFLHRRTKTTEATQVLHRVVSCSFKQTKLIHGNVDSHSHENLVVFAAAASSPCSPLSLVTVLSMPVATALLSLSSQALTLVPSLPLSGIIFAAAITLISLSTPPLAPLRRLLMPLTRQVAAFSTV